MFHSLRSLTAISSASSSQNFKAITAIALDKVLEPPFNFCVAKRRSLHLYYITENQLGTTKEIPLADGAILLRKCGRSILAADAQNYKLVNERNGSVTTLFPYDRAVMKPIICAIGRSEFLLVLATAPGVALGMFVNSNGDAVRGTLQWSAIPKSIVFHFPYTIALLRTNVLEIHNLFTQELHATVPIPSPALFLQDTSFPLQLHSQKRTMKTVVVCSGGVVLGVLVKRVEGQIEEFLEAREIGKAIQLAELAVQWGETGDTKKQVFDRIYEQAGVLYFKDLSFDEAVKCFKKGDVDPFILINEFGGIVAIEGAEALVPWKEDIEQAREY
ncbi:transforming growth factor, beta receptor associated protein 1 [Rhizoclosmatium hyalinum]|nr:transforming growth factor, beta receptor associated protein 1 [Rhizoclosmatium hyalinum]